MVVGLVVVLFIIEGSQNTVELQMPPRGSVVFRESIRLTLQSTVFPTGFTLPRTTILIELVAFVVFLLAKLVSTRQGKEGGLSEQNASSDLLFLSRSYVVAFHV